MSLADGWNAVSLVAERKILEAMAEGQFDNLPGRGKPLKLEDISHLPPEMRLAYTVLKNSGYLEASATELKAAPNLPGLLSQTTGESRDCGRLERLRFKLSRRNRSSSARSVPEPSADSDALDGLEPAYVEKLLKRL